MIHNPLPDATLARLIARVETNLKVTDGPGMDVRFSMNRDAATEFVKYLRLTGDLISRLEAAEAERERAEARAAAAEAEMDALHKAAQPFVAHDWMDADLEDDNCALTKHSGHVTVGHWRALRAAYFSAALTANPKDTEEEQ